MSTAGINPLALMQLLTGMNNGVTTNTGQTFHHVFESSSLNFNIEMTLKLIPKVHTPQVHTPQVDAQIATAKTTGKRKTVQFDVAANNATKKSATVVVPKKTEKIVEPVPFDASQLKPVSTVKPIVVDEVAKRINKFKQNKLLPYNRELLSTLIPRFDNSFQPVQLLVSLANTYTSQPYKFKSVVYHVVDLTDSPTSAEPCNLVLLVNETFGKLMNSSAIQSLCKHLELGQDILKVNVSHNGFTSPRRCVTGRGLVKLCACLYTDDAAIKQAVEEMVTVAKYLRWRYNPIDDSKAADSDATDTDTDME